jgi:transcriptional regulator with XRE-family HTH domain
MDEYEFNPLDFGPNPQKTMEGIRDRMRIRRKWLHWSQKELARRSGVSYGSIKRFEDKCEISLHSLVKIAFYLDSLDNFDKLFVPKNYSSIDEIIYEKKHRRQN